MDTGTTRRVRSVVTTLALIVAGAVLAWAFFWGINLHARFEAQSLVHIVGSMQVGSTTLEETRPLLERYHASTIPTSLAHQHAADSGFYVSAEEESLRGLRERFYFLRYAGLVFWWAGAELYFRNRQLCSFRFTFETEVNRKAGFREGFYLTTEQSLGYNEFIMSGGHMTGGSRYMFVRVYDITLPSNATPSERAHAFAYNFSYVARLGGCRDVGQVLDGMPIRHDFDIRHPD